MVSPTLGISRSGAHSCTRRCRLDAKVGCAVVHNPDSHLFLEHCEERCSLLDILIPSDVSGIERGDSSQVDFSLITKMWL